MLHPRLSFHTFTGLDPQEKYRVWVRKVCHYATLGYSDWSPTVGFSVEGAGTEGIPRPTAGGGVKVYFSSMKGTELPSMYCGILPSHFCTAS